MEDDRALHCNGRPNALEDFHCQHLSDEQIKELNTLIRDAVYNALCSHAHFESSSEAQRFVQHHTEMIPLYWEMPRLYESFKPSAAFNTVDESPDNILPLL